MDPIHSSRADASRDLETEKKIRSPSNLLAFRDIGFITRNALRPVRLQLELLKPELIQNEEGIRSTIAVFGSARIPSPEDADYMRQKARDKLAESPDDPAVQREARILENLAKKSRYYQEARKFSRLVSEACQRDAKCDFVICTGGGPGIMEAANRGAHEVGAKSIGLNITLPHEQEANPYITNELCFRFHYFAIRKMHFLLRAKALVVFPGGFGTFDELFETLTLIQTTKMEYVPVVLFGQEFWNRAVNFEFLVEEGVISPGDLNLFSIVETAEEAWEFLTRYFKNGHAMKAAGEIAADDPAETGKDHLDPS